MEGEENGPKEPRGSEDDAVDREIAQLHPRRWAEARAKIAAFRAQTGSDEQADSVPPNVAGLRTARMHEIVELLRGGRGALRAHGATLPRMPDRLPAEVVALVEKAIGTVLAADPNATPSDLVREVAGRCSAMGLSPPSRLTLTRRLARHIAEMGGRAAAGSAPTTPLVHLVVDRAALEIATTAAEGPTTVPLVAFALDEATGAVLAHEVVEEGSWPCQSARVLAAALRSVPALATGAVLPATVLTDRVGPRRAWRLFEAALARAGSRLVLREARSPATGTLVARVAGQRVAGIPVIAQRHLAGGDAPASRFAIARAIRMEPIAACELRRMVAAAVAVHNRGRLDLARASDDVAPGAFADRVAVLAAALDAIADRRG